MAKKTTNDMPEVVKSKTFEGFTIVKDEKGKFNIVIGNALISNKKFASPEKAEEYITTKPYELIFNTVFFILDKKQHETSQKEN